MALVNEIDEILFYRLRSQLTTLNNTMGSLAVTYHEKALSEV